MPTSFLPQLRRGTIGLVSIVLVLASLQAATPAQAATPLACPSGTYQVYTTGPWGNAALVIDSRNVCAVAFDAAGGVNWSVPQGISLIEAVIVGGGGGGGASGHFGIPNGYLSGGGGGGGDVKFQALNVTPGQPIKISIGAGGNGGKYVDSGSKSTDGSDGATTTLVHNGQTYSAAGGKGGKSGDNGGTGGASGNGNIGGASISATSTVSPAPVLLGAGGGGGGAAQGAVGSPATIRNDASTKSTIGGDGGSCWTPPLAQSTYFQSGHFGPTNNLYAANAYCLGLGGGGGTYVAAAPDFIAAGRPSNTALAQRPSQSSTCTWPNTGTRTAPMAATYSGTGYPFYPTSGYASGSGAGGGCGVSGGMGGRGNSGLVWMRFLAPTAPMVKVTGKAANYNYSPSTVAAKPEVLTDPQSTLTSQPTCDIYASSDTAYATPLSGKVLNPGEYVTHCSGGSLDGSTLFYPDTGFLVSRPLLTAALKSILNDGRTLPVSVTAYNSANLTQNNATVVIGSEPSTQTVNLGGRSGPMTFKVNPADKANCGFDVSSDPLDQTGTISFLKPGDCRITITQEAGSGFTTGQTINIWVKITAFDSTAAGAVDPQASQSPDPGSGTVDPTYTDNNTKNPDTVPAVVVPFGAGESINAGGGVALAYKSATGEITPSVLTAYVGTMSWTLTADGGAKIFDNKTCSKTKKVKGKTVCQTYKTVASATCTAKTVFPMNAKQVGMVRRALTPACKLNTAGKAALAATNAETVVKGALFFDRLHAQNGKKTMVISGKSVTLKNVKRTIVLKLGKKP